ncbi:MAG: GerMN domain-containing protein [Patescibacteria group bacterium]
MNKAIYICLIVGVVVLGFAAGRLTGEGQAGNTAIVKRLFPLLPAPPKETAAIDPAPVEAKEPSAALIVEVPGDGAAVSPVFEVAGRAKMNGGAIMIEITDVSGQVLFRERTPVTGNPGDDYGRFSQSVSLDAADVREIRVSVAFETADGGLSDEAIVRTVFLSDPDSFAIKIYLNRMGVEASSQCDSVEAVERIVSSKGAVYRSAIAELLKGPTAEEKTAGLYSSLPRGATLRSVATDADGVVTADFYRTLESGVAGSCRVQAIRAQITSTLQQFPEVRGVVISVNGRTEDVLQP